MTLTARRPRQSAVTRSSSASSAWLVTAFGKSIGDSLNEHVGKDE